MSRTLIIGDVHGCAAPLERLLHKARPDRVILVGDVFCRGPDPRGVWALIKAWDVESVLGNRDEHVLTSWRADRDLPRAAFRWLAGLPLTIKLDGAVIVHAGLHPDGLKHTRRKHALYLRDHKGRPWYEAYSGRRLIIHGHDARRGLIDRRPHTLGLDTDCVRGGRLTGYLLEKDRLVSVRGQQAQRSAS